MPYVNVRVLEGVSAEQKVRVIERITQVLVEELGKDPAGTFVVIDEVSTDNWGHYGTTVTKLRAAKKAAAKSSPSKAAARVTGPSAKKGAVRKS